MFVFFYFFFFFQAEDGIRDAQESRGLGDVYKRQFMKNAYQEAVTKHYRFFSFGDTTLIL